MNSHFTCRDDFGDYIMNYEAGRAPLAFIKGTALMSAMSDRIGRIPGVGSFF